MDTKRLAEQRASAEWDRLCAVERDTLRSLDRVAWTREDEIRHPVVLVSLRSLGLVEKWRKRLPSGQRVAMYRRTEWGTRVLRPELAAVSRAHEGPEES